MPTNHILLFSRDIDSMNIVHSKFPNQTTHWDEGEIKEPKPVHKRSSLAKTESTNAFRANIFNSKPPTLEVRTFELLEFKPLTDSLTSERKEKDDTNTSFRAISESKIETTGAEPAKERTQEEDTNGTKSTKLSFFKMTDTWSAISFIEHSKDANRLFKPVNSEEKNFNKKDVTPEIAPTPETPEEITWGEELPAIWAHVFPPKKTGQVIKACFLLYIPAK
ncbi:hypothetical protein G9A89_013216 [Geosiphon pyriformis]|nr:hypothetical protein G9A89_013216 [Geosiphon pyriformis]